MNCNDEQAPRFIPTDNDLITPTDQIRYSASMIYQEVKRQADDQLSMIHDADDLSTAEKIALSNQVQDRELIFMVALLAITCLAIAIK